MTRQHGMVGEVVDRLLPGPPVTMDARIDHEARGAPHLVALLAEALVGRAVDAHLDAEIFAVKTPAFTVPREIDVAAEARQRLAFAGDCGLEAVAGRAFVQRENGDVVEWPARQVV